MTTNIKNCNKLAKKLLANNKLAKKTTYKYDGINPIPNTIIKKTDINDDEIKKLVSLAVELNDKNIIYYGGSYNFKIGKLRIFVLIHILLC